MTNLFLSKRSKHNHISSLHESPFLDSLINQAFYPNGEDEHLDPTVASHSSCYGGHYVGDNPADFLLSPDDIIPDSQKHLLHARLSPAYVNYSRLLVKPF